MKTLFGLPQEVKFCKTCVISNQRPNSCLEYAHKFDTKKATIHFNEDGRCDACVVAEKKRETIDWEKRDRELRELCDKYRRSDGGYDCLIPGSGGKDSFFAAYNLKYKYNMHPLTITWAPHIYTDWGWKNFQSWIHAGFDNILFTPNGRIHRLVSRLALENLFHPFQPFIIGQKSLPARVAAQYDIHLVFYGENEAEYGNPKADSESAKRDWSYFIASGEKEIYLGGVTLEQLKKDYGLEENDTQLYLPADPKILKEKKIDIYYLGHYLRWHPQGAYYFAVEHGGFQASPERTPGTYSKYNSIDDRIDDFSYWTTFIKYGIGRSTYDASQEIRSGEITRDEGVALVKRFDGEFPERFAEELFRYLSVDEKQFPKAFKMFHHPKVNREYFMDLADKFRSPHLWKKENKKWVLLHQVS